MYSGITLQAIGQPPFALFAVSAKVTWMRLDLIARKSIATLTVAGRTRIATMTKNLLFEMRMYT
jgi:hypothetical protein